MHPRQSLGADKTKSKALTAAEVFKRAAPVVVAIDCLGDNNVKIATASGFIVSDNGKIATNFHVIKSCKSLAVRLTNGDVYDSTWVIALDVRRDLALIRIKAASLPVLPLAESNDIEVGDTVYSLGNASGLQNTLQQGLVSAFREINGSRLVQVGASLNPGNSGGPILNEQGRVVAIAVAIINGAENLGFASITPVFSQLLVFTLPKGFRPVIQNVNGPAYIQVSVLAGETLQQWTQSVTVIATKGVASKPDAYPKSIFEAVTRKQKERHLYS